jgi:hypothetical protein
MSVFKLRAVALLPAAALAASCATHAPTVTTDIPAALQAPPGEVLFFEAFANGVQIYECVSKAEPAGAFEWSFRAPEAVLVDRAGRTIGKHHAGPTWESSDGSAVVGEVKARSAAPTATAIPWLLLSAKSKTGTGVFSPTTSVQRVQTVGGAAPSSACGPANRHEMSRVPYTASYYFYRAR